MKKKELLQLIEALRARVEILEAQIQSKQDTFSPTPSVWTIGGCHSGGLCEYPSPWFGVVPPPCKKCGKVSQYPYTITSTTVSLSDCSTCIDGKCQCKL